MDVGITELEKIEATRVDGVETPANGIPILLLKSAAPVAEPEAEKPAEFDREAAKSLVRGIIAKAVGADGQVDEEPDVQGGTEVLERIADLIIAEAQELKSGQAGEICDIQQLACAAEMIWCWRTGEEAVSTGSVMPATALLQSAAKADMSTASINDLPDSAFAYIEPGGSKDEDGRTTPRSLRHFPVHDAAHTRNALSRAPQSPFGEKAMPKIRAAAKKFGIEVSDTSKSQIAKEGATVDTVTQTGDLSEVVKAAVTEAAAPLVKRVDELESSNKALRDELAKVKATPVPGGPVLSRNVQVKTPGGAVNEDLAAKAARYRVKAAEATSPQDRDGYLALARETEQQAKIPS